MNEHDKHMPAATRAVVGQTADFFGTKHPSKDRRGAAPGLSGAIPEIFSAFPRTKEI
jgi:hypothetical protein